MYDFDLSDALESPLGPDRTGRGFSGCEGTDFRDEVIELDAGLDLVVSRNPKTMRGAVTLVLALNRMRKLLTCGGGGGGDLDLCSEDELRRAIMESVIEETIVEKKASSSAEKTKVFYRVNSGRECSLCDTSKKDIVSGAGGWNLKAVTLKGGNSQHTVNFKLSSYATTDVAPGDGQIIVLSIVQHNLHISCTMRDDRAELHLEECSKEDLRNISDDGDMDRFLFYKRTTGTSLTTFESVKFRGWFISTSYREENQPVEMCRVDTSQRLTCFNMK